MFINNIDKVIRLIPSTTPSMPCANSIQVQYHKYFMVNDITILLGLLYAFFTEITNIDWIYLKQ